MLRVPRVQQHASSTSVLYMCKKLYCFVYNVLSNTPRLHLFYVWAYNCITSCTTYKTPPIVYIYFMYEHTTILPREQRKQQPRSSTSVLSMCIQLYYLVYNMYNNTHRLHLFYISVSNYIASRRTTHIVYICYMYEYAKLLPRVQRVK